MAALQPEENIVFGLVPARAGSKGIANKNLRTLNCSPLLSHSITYALNDPIVNKVFVSTDCEEIAKVSADFGADVPFLRPAEISGDLCRDESFVAHFLEYLNSSLIDCDYIALLRPTSPIRPVGIITQALELAKKHKASCVRAVTDASCNPFKCWFEEKSDSPILSPVSSYLHEPYNAPRQVLPRYYWQTGQLDLIHVESFNETKSITGNKIVGLFVDGDYAFDIDSLDDFKSVEGASNRLKPNQSFPQ